MKKCWLFNEDYFKFIKSIKSNSIDLILSDPPYNINKYSTGNIFIFTGYNKFGSWHETFDPLFDTFQFMVWHKLNPTPKIYKSGFLNSCELIVCMWNKGHYWNFTSQDEMHIWGLAQLE